MTFEDRRNEAMTQTLEIARMLNEDALKAGIKVIPFNDARCNRTFWMDAAARFIQTVAQGL